MMRKSFVVYASTGRCMSEPYYTRESAQDYANSLMIDFADDGTFFFVEEVAS